LLGFTGPDEDQIVALDHGIAAHAKLRRDVVLSGNLDTAAVGSELHAVIHAPDIVAFDAAHRQRRRAMTAAIIQRHDFAAGAAIEHDRFFENCARELLAVDQLVIPGRDIPGIVEKDSLAVHVVLLLGFALISRATTVRRVLDLSGHTVHVDGQSPNGLA